jgi:hypothetical protein
MRIQNKYIRNRCFRNKAWKTIRDQSHPFKTYAPYYIYGTKYYSFEDQVKQNFEWIAEQARAMESGHHRSFFHAPKHYRKILWKQRKAQERSVMTRIRNGDHELESPKFKRDADWLWF